MNQKKKEKVNEIKNKGKLVLDATVAPSDISYPTDLKLLNEVRKHTEKVIDCLYKRLKKLLKKPRTYRKIAKKNYLLVAKSRRPKRKEIRQAIRKQLRYVRRNLSHIEKLIGEGADLETLSRRQYKKLLVATEIYRQQLLMYENKTKRVDDRIVSLSQPHVTILLG